MTKSFRVAACGVAVSALMSGCVELRTYDYSKVSPGELPDGAVPYTLPKAVFDVSIIYSFNGCDLTVVDESKDVAKINLHVSQKISVTPNFVPDNKERYYVKIDDLNKWIKDSKITISTNQNSTLSAVNVTANDLAGPTITNALGMAVSVAGAAYLGDVKIPRVAEVRGYANGVEPPYPPYPPYKGVCGESIGDTRQVVDALGGRLDAKLVSTLVRIAALKREIADRTVEAIRRKFDPARDPVISDDSAQLAKAISALNISTSMRWEPRPSDPLFLQIKDEDAVSAWLKKDGKGNPIGKRDDLDMKYPLIEVRLDGVTGSQVGSKGAPYDPKGVVHGLVMRVPANATLRACVVKSDKDTVCPDMRSSTLNPISEAQSTLDVAMPQFGRRLVLPMKDRIFENRNLTVALNADGSISSVGTQATGTASINLQALTAVAASASTAIAAHNSAITQANSAVGSEYNQVQITNATLPGVQADTANKALADCYSQQKAVAAAGGKPLPCQ